MTGSVEQDFGSKTVGELLNDESLMTVLGAPEGVKALSGGQTLPSEALVSDYAVITLERQSSSKAA